MKPAPLAVLAASLLAGIMVLPPAGAAPEGIATIGPPEAGRAAWSNERMLGARERLKVILPGSRE